MPQTGAMVELQLAGTWTDVTPRAYLRAPIRITRGRQDEGARVDPGSCTITLNNKGGYFSPRNPLSPLYGLIGRNTPVRVSTVAGSPWLDLPPSGIDHRASTPSTTALNVTGDLDVRFDVRPDNWFDGSAVVELGGKSGAAGQRSWRCYLFAGFITLVWTTDGTTEVSAAGYLGGVELRPRMVVRAVLDVNNGAGGHTARFYLGPTVAGPWTQVGGDQVSAGTSATFSSTAPVEFGDVSSIGLAHAPARLYAAQIRNGIDGTIVASPDFTAQAAGATAFTDGVGVPWTLNSAAGITNRQPRFVGEISSWPARWDVSGGDVYTPVQAAGIMRRLGQGSDPLRSTLARRVPSDPNLVAYWPMEETGGTQAYSPVQGTSPMRVVGMQWSADDSLPGSLALPVVQSPCSINAAVPGWSSPTQWRTELVYRLNTVPSSIGTMINFTSNGTVKRWTIRYGNGQVEVIGVDGDGNTVVDDLITPIDNAVLYNGWVRQQFWLTQSGGSVAWHIGWIDIGGTTGVGWDDTYTGTAGACTGVTSAFSTQTVGTAIAHVAVFKTSASSIYNSADTGFTGETAAARLARLTTEEGVSYVTPYGTVGTTSMGPQTADTLLDLCGAAEDADMGILYEHRDSIALAYRPRTSLYNQPVTLPMDYTERGLTTPLDPTDDDQATTNDVTVSRPSGSSARATLDTGALSTQPPPAGVGRYATSETVNVATDDQLPDIAGWLLHLGTWDAQRYPSVSVNLAAASSALVAAATAVDVGDRAQIANPPQWLPPGTIDLIVEGYTETIGWADWSITYNCSPGAPWQVGVIEGTSLPARFDTDGCQLAASATATASTLVLATTTGRQWVNSIQYPAEFPFDLAVGGERVTVNSLGGVVADNFERTASSGWGVTNTGDTWTTSGGSASDFSVSGGLGRMSLGSVNVSRWARVPSAYADVDLSVFLSTSALAAGGSQYVALAARAADTNNAYLARLAANTDQTMTLTVIKRLASTETVLGTYVVPGLTHVAGGYYGLRFKVAGSTLQARAWPFVYAEPSGWPITATDTDLTAAGTVGIRCLLSSSNTNTLPVTATFDGFQQQTPQTAFVTRSVNGISKAQSAGTAVALADPTYIAL